MRVALTNPFAWPHVRRGAERLLNDFAAYLADRGHEVTVYAMAPRAGVEHRGRVAYRLLAEPRRPHWRQFNRCHAFAFALARALEGDAHDAVHCLNYFDAFAALRARRRARGRFRVVYQSVGIPTRRYFRAVPIDAWFVRSVLREADAVLVLSEFARACLERDFGRAAEVLPPPVTTADFAAPPTSRPPSSRTLLFVGDVDEPRKGARVLCRAFGDVHARHPDVELILAGRASERTRRALLALPELARARDRVRFLGVGDVADLPPLYRAASATVLPAVWEAFGLVLVESLAAGTPVIGARHAGIPDVVQGEQVGRLFDPGAFAEQSDNANALAEAILAVLAQDKSESVVRACRARAERYSWSVLGPRYEAVLRGAAA